MAICYKCNKSTSVKENTAPHLQGLCVGCSSKLRSRVEDIVQFIAAHDKARHDLPIIGEGPRAYTNYVLDATETSTTKDDGGYTDA